MTITDLIIDLRKFNREYGDILATNGYDSITIFIQSLYRAELSNYGKEAPKHIIETYTRNKSKYVSLVENCKKYGVGTKYECLIEIIGSVDKVIGLMNSSYGKTIEEVINRLGTITESKLRAIKIDYNTYNNYSKNREIGIKDIRESLNEPDISITAIKLITSGIVFGLSDKIQDDDLIKILRNYLYKTNIDIERISFYTAYNQLYEVVRLIGCTKLFTTINFSFKDTNNWPYKDNLVELLIARLDNFKYNSDIESKLRMVGISKYKGLDTNESYLLMVIKDLLELINNKGCK